jgi:hypothetical protein
MYFKITYGSCCRSGYSLTYVVFIVTWLLVMNEICMAEVKMTEYCTRDEECMDDNKCTDDGCSAHGTCYHVPKSPQYCLDNNRCTTDFCDKARGCMHVRKNCTGNSKCTEYYCDETIGCTSRPLSCEDFDKCTFDYCDQVRGCRHERIKCKQDPNNQCVMISCDPNTGECVDEKIHCGEETTEMNNKFCIVPYCDVDEGCVVRTMDCDDGDFCTKDSCIGGGKCSHTPVDCNDSKVCTKDSCLRDRGCQHVRISCKYMTDPYDKCTEYECVEPFGCIPKNVSCSDHDICTIDTCSASVGCVHTPMCIPDSEICVVKNDRAKCISVDYKSQRNTGVINVGDHFRCNGTYSKKPCATKNNKDDEKRSSETKTVLEQNCCSDDDCDFLSSIDFGFLQKQKESVENVLMKVTMCSRGRCEYIINTAAVKDKYTEIKKFVNQWSNMVSAVSDYTNIFATSNRNDRPASIALQSYSSPLRYKIPEPPTCDDGNLCTSDYYNVITNKCINTRVDCTGACGTIATETCAECACNENDGKCGVVTATEMKGCITEDNKMVDACSQTMCVDNTCITREKDCSDGLKCTIDECVHPFGICKYTVIDCTDTDPYTKDTCEETTGKCLHTVSMKCPSPDLCTIAEYDETNDVCRFTDVICNDNDFCTRDVCIRDVGCVHIPDGYKNCTSDNFCFFGMCNPGNGKCVKIPRSCNDNFACTKDTCDPEAKMCIHEEVMCESQRTEDGDEYENRELSCNTLSGMCEPVWKSCSDGDQCTLDYNIPGYGCIHSNFIYEPDHAQCITFICDKRSGQPMQVPFDCSDGDVNTFDECVKNVGCTHRLPGLYEILRRINRITFVGDAVETKNNDLKNDLPLRCCGDEEVVKDILIINEGCAIVNCTNSTIESCIVIPKPRGLTCNTIDSCNRFSCTGTGMCALRSRMNRSCIKKAFARGQTSGIIIVCVTSTILFIVFLVTVISVPRRARRGLKKIFLSKQ